MADNNLKIVDNYQNIKGTLRPSFKIGPDGVELVSRVVENSALRELYIKKGANDTTGTRIFTENDLDNLYDMNIPNRAIASYSESDDGRFVTFYLHDGRTMRIPTTISNLEQAGTVIGPERSTAGNIATFSDASGQSLDDQGHGITSAFTGAGSQYEESVNIPTVGAIWKLVGEAKLLLYARLQGLVDSNGHTTEQIEDHIHVWDTSQTTYFLINDDKTVVKREVCALNSSHTKETVVTVSRIAYSISEENDQMNLNIVSPEIGNDFDYRLKITIDGEDIYYSITGRTIMISLEDTESIQNATNVTVTPIIWNQELAAYELELADGGNTTPDPDTPVLQTIESTFAFTTKSWDDETDSWLSLVDGSGYMNDGVQTTASLGSASAVSVGSFTDVSKIVVEYCTNTSDGIGSISVQVGENDPLTMDVTKPAKGTGTTPKEFEYIFETAQTGNITISTTCTKNSVYVRKITITHVVPRE